LTRQDIVICEKCGVLKELFEECGCSEEKETLIKTDSQNPDPLPISKGRQTENGSAKFRQQRKRPSWK